MGPYESAGPTFVIWAITLSTADPFQKNIIDPISFLQREVARKGDGVFWLPPSTDFSSLKARHSSVGAACCTLSSAHCYAQQRMRWHSARARRYAKNLWTCCRAWRIGRLNTGSHTKHHKKSPSAHFFVEKIRIPLPSYMRQQGLVISGITRSTWAVSLGNKIFSCTCIVLPVFRAHIFYAGAIGFVKL